MSLQELETAVSQLPVDELTAFARCLRSISVVLDWSA